MRSGISGRMPAREDPQTEKAVLQKIFDHIPLMINFIDKKGRIELVNPEWERTLGWSLDEIKEQNLDIFALCYPDPVYRQTVKDFARTATGEWADLKTRIRDGQVIDTAWAVIRLSDGTAIGIGQKITERKRMERALKATTEQLRALSDSVNSAREEERARIARELHDELGSSLTSLRWNLDEIDRMVSKGGRRADAPLLRERIAGATNLVDDTINAVKRIAAELRPTILDDLGLVAAVEWQAQQCEESMGLTCRMDSEVETARLSSEQAIAVFRIFQEAMTNVLRHAKATSVLITVKEEQGAFVLEVRDNGRGITKEQSSSQSLGLLGMRERARLAGGRVNIAGVAGQGTVVTVRVPLQPGSAHDQ